MEGAEKNTLNIRTHTIIYEHQINGYLIRRYQAFSFYYYCSAQTTYYGTVLKNLLAIVLRF